MESPGSEPGTPSDETLREALDLHALFARLTEDQRAFILGLVRRAAGLSE